MKNGRFLIPLLAFALLASITVTHAQPPDDFPRFVVPGFESEMETLRRLHWLHYPGAGPKSTLWDEWLSAPALWPAVETDGRLARFRSEWAAALRGRIMDDDGYVASHQHASIAHQLGWPFPFWKQGGPGAWGWHFSLANVPDGWHGTEVKSAEGWTLDGADDLGIDETAWRIELTAPRATVSAPAVAIDVLQSPFVQLRWMASGLGDAQPYIEWATAEQPEYGAERRFHFAPIESASAQYSMIPVYRHPEWRGTVTGWRVNLGNAAPGARVGIQALFTQYDTRHNINNANFVRGCAKYFLYTGDINFIREQVNRMRLAMRYVMTEFHARELGVVQTDWVGHDGRSGLQRDGDGNKTLLHGHGVGNNYWDLLPFGHQDAYATVQYYDALLRMAAIEEAIVSYPEWNVARGVSAFDAEELRSDAGEVKARGNALFWNDETQRFAAGVDADGVRHDYGFTFLNLEAVHYGFATDEHADAIMTWIAGDRMVDGDTAQGDDIYHWRFGPRATTRRNIDYYGWYWSSPESIPWGGQVQDGGAVLGFSYHDMMSRLRTRGADDAWARLQELIAWYADVEAAGGYRKYYDGSRDGTLQGGGTAGGLGCDQEFFESVLVPQVMIDGFLGFVPSHGGFAVNPNLPLDWPSLTIDRIHLRGAIYTIRATKEHVEITVVDASARVRESETVSIGARTAVLPVVEGETVTFALGE